MKPLKVRVIFSAKYEDVLREACMLSHMKQRITRTGVERGLRLGFMRCGLVVGDYGVTFSQDDIKKAIKFIEESYS